MRKTPDKGSWTVLISVMAELLPEQPSGTLVLSTLNKI